MTKIRWGLLSTANINRRLIPAIRYPLWARARPEEGDKGGDAARAALAMLRLKRKLAGPES